jgi:hypothetical protein
MITMGKTAAANAELNRDTSIWKQKGVLGTLNYLMDVQHRASPTDVDFPMAALRIDKSGAMQWLQKGACD